MAESLYRRKPIVQVVDILKARRKLMDLPQTGGESTSVRNPCYVKLTGHDMRCGGSGQMTLPFDNQSWDSTYKPKFKPSPDVESVTIDYGGDWGLARKLSATIRCYTISDFELVQEKFLLPGNEVDVEFGYAQNQWGYGNSGKLQGFKVASFSFSTTQDGHWIASFTAVSSAIAIKNLDMQIVVCNGCSDGTGQSGNSGPIVYFTGIDLTKHPVKGVAQLIAADAQKNGQFSIDSLKDGEVITSFVNYSPGSQDKSAAIVVYSGDHIRDTMDKFMAWSGGIAKDLGFGKSEVEAANNQVYLTLGYIVNRIINDQLLKAMGCGVAHERDKFNELKIEFHPEYSKCKIGDQITSGDPLSVLLLGDANYKNDSGEGKDFDGDCKNLGAVKSNSSGDIKLQNILVHRDVVVAAFTEATKKREADSDNTDVKDTKEETINIVDFFEKLADHISSAVGGAISLRLVEHPDNLKKLLVVDQNFGVSDELPVIVFDPIDGDGSTRTCDVQSNVGSQEYKAAMFVGSSKKGDSIAVLRGCNDKLKDQRQSEYNKANTDAYALVIDPGNLGKNYFNGQDINALKSIMSRLNKNNPQIATNETVHYPGLSISIDIDGIWGFVPGNGISSTQIPAKWRNEYKSYFMVTRVEQRLQGSSWETHLDGILAYYPKVNYINL